MKEAIIFINHVYLVLSSNSFEAIKDNAFLNSQFANVEHKNLASNNDLKWEGLYIRGENTYIELFYPQGEAQFSKKGNSGIGLGTDKVGDINLVYVNLKNTAANISKNKFTRTVEGKEQVWFTYVTQKDSFIAPYLSLWLMEYEPSYCGSKDITRKTYNKPYYEPSKLFKNISGLTIAIEVGSQENFINLLNNSGYVCSQISEAHYKCQAHDFTIEIIPQTPTQKGIQKIDLALNTSVKPQSHKLGDAILTLEGSSGTWKFY